MLRKLLKYNLKDIYKGLIIFYSLSLFFAVLTRLFLGIENSFVMNIIGKICSGTAIAMIFNIIINNLMRLWVRFRQNLYGDESYLTHTLPIEKNILYLSKILTSLITLFTSIVVIAIALFIAYYSKENIQLVKNLLMPLAEMYDSTVLTILFAFIFVMFLEIMNILMSGYVGIVSGHRMNNNKMLYSIFFGFGIYLFTQIFAVLAIFICAIFNSDLMNLFYTMNALNIDIIKLCIYMAIIIYTISIFVLYFVNLKLFSKGVNVD